MGLALRFISASTGMVTFVIGAPVGVGVELVGNLVMLNGFSSAAPFVRMRPVQGEYTPGDGDGGNGDIPFC